MAMVAMRDGSWSTGFLVRGLSTRRRLARHRWPVVMVDAAGFAAQPRPTPDRSHHGRRNPFATVSEP